MNVMLTKLLLASVTAATVGTPDCPSVVRITGDDSAAVAILGDRLRRAGIAASSGAVETCASFEAHIAGSAPPYTLRLRGPRTEQRSWRVHLVDLGAAMIESVVGEPPRATAARPTVPAVPLPIAISARIEAATDANGGVFVGPGAHLSYCFGISCLDLMGRFGFDAIAAGSRTDASMTFGPSLHGQGEEWSIHGGIGFGFRWIRVEEPPPFRTTFMGGEWPLGPRLGSAITPAFEIDLGAAFAIDSELSLDAMVALQLMPESNDTSDSPTFEFNATLAARVGVGVRWGHNGLSGRAP